MSRKKRIVADLLFWVQLICTLIFGISQFIKTLSTTEGISTSMFWSWEFFLTLNLIMALKAHRNKPSRVTRQTIISYITWIVMITLDLIAIYAKNTGIWNARDTWATILVAVGIVVIVIVKHFKRLPATDPMIKTSLSVAFKVIPQLVWAYNITLVGGGGLAWPAILAGHVTISSRIGQIWFAIREAGWDRNRIGLFISETSNEFSWLVVSITWLICR